MAKKTNCRINGKDYYKINRKVGKKLNTQGEWIDDCRTFYGSSKKDAEAKYYEFLEGKKSALNVSEKPVGTYVDSWIDNVFMYSNLAQSSKKKYVTSYRNNFQSEQIAKMPIGQLTSLDLQEFFNNSTATYSAKRSLLNLLSKFFKYASLNGFASDITTSIQIPKPKTAGNDFKQIDVWEDGDLKKLMAGLEGHRLRLLVILAVNTGARFSELLALTYDDIRDDCIYIYKQTYEGTIEEGITITSPKSQNSNRAIPLPPEIMAEIEVHKRWQRKDMAENSYITNKLFTTSTGNYYFRRSVMHALERLYKQIDVPYHKFHSFRHTFATNLSRAGVPIEETSALLGHSSIEMTAKYYVDISTKRKMEAMKKVVGFSL